MSGAVATFAFGVFALDSDRFELRRNGRVVPMQRQVFQALGYLLRHRDRVVSKEELLREAWPGVVVTHGAVSQVISLARKAVDDDGDKQAVIQTVRGLGFRFVAEARERGVRPSETMRAAAHGLVGRASELERLRERFAAADGGAGGVILVQGQAGVGKTTLVEHLTTEASGWGARTLWGRCQEGEGSEPFAMWSATLHALWELRPPEITADRLLDVERLLPSLPTSGPRGTARGSSEGAGTRFRAFEVVASLLRHASRHQPIVIALEDLHAADEPSLLLLEYLASELPTTRVLALATFRDSESGPLERLVSALGDAPRLQLDGLSPDEVAGWLEQRLGRKPQSAVLEAVMDVTGGNPLVVGELLRALQTRGGLEHAAPVLDSFRVPDHVSQAIRRSLSALPAETLGLLSLSSVIGNELDVAVLRDAAGVPAERVLAALAPAIKGGRLREVGVGRYAFAHSVVRETLYGDLPPDERARAHRRIADVLSRTPGTAKAELAHHFYLASPAGDAAAAVFHLREAAREAHQRLAYEDALVLLERARVALAKAPDPRLDAELSTELGTAFRCAGLAPRAVDSIERAIDLAKAAGDVTLVARAVDELAATQKNIVDFSVIARLQEALAMLPAEDSVLRASLSARLALASAFGPDRGAPEALAREAVAMAERLGAERTLAIALHAWRWTYRGDAPAEERLRVARAAVSAALAARDWSLACEARIWTIGDLLELGRKQEFEAELALHLREAASLRLPWLRLIAARFGVVTTLLAGRLQEADRLADETLSMGRAVGDANATLVYWIEMVALLREQGRLSEIEAFARSVAEFIPWDTTWRSVVVWILAHTGRLDEARQRFDELARDEFAGIAPDLNYLGAVALLAETSVLLHDGRAGAVLRRKLAALDVKHFVAAGCSLYFGPTARAIGLIAADAGELDEAVGELERGLAAAEAMGALGWAARTRIELAGVRWSRDASGDRRRAIDEVTVGLDAARELGMTTLLAEARALPGELRSRVRSLRE